MSSYPLYDKLVEKCKTKQEFNLDNLCYTINSLNKEHSEIIYSIILHHAIVSGMDVSNNPPYEIKTLPVGKGMTVKLDKLPNELQRILYCYLNNN